MSSAAERLHGDDTTVPILAKGKTDTGRVWTYVRDERPFGGPSRQPRCSTPRATGDGEHPERHLKAFTGILQADAYGGYNRLYHPDRKPGPVTEAICWAMRGASSSCWPTSPPMPVEERPRRRSRRLPSRPSNASISCSTSNAISTASPQPNALSCVRSGVRRSSPSWKNGFASERAKLSRHAPVAQAIDYMLKRWAGFTRFLEDGRICLTNNAAERALRGLALGRKSWLFADSQRGADRAAVMYTLIATASLNDVDPQAWIADVFARIADTPQGRLSDLLPWNWHLSTVTAKAA